MKRAGLAEFLCAAAALTVLVAPAWGAATDVQKCQASKNKAAGKYAACRQNAEKGLASTGDAVKYGDAITKCEGKFATAWQKAIDNATAASATCPDAPLVAADYKPVIDRHTNRIATALAGGGLREFPASGQVTAYGTGSDGDVQAGTALSYTDNGDGTITDNVTGLMWEKKDDSAGIHGQNNMYTWSGASYLDTNVMDGTIATFLATLNAGGGFAGHTDWRIPNYKELTSILDLGVRPGPTVSAAFHNAAGCTGCSDVTLATCSCTRANVHWSSSTLHAANRALAWVVFFNGQYIDGTGGKSLGYAVRAVRGGL